MELNEARLYRLWIPELSDDAGPRINPEKPNLYVGRRTLEPERQMLKFMSGRNREHAAGTWAIRGRQDLADTEGWRTPADARAARRDPIVRLCREGYTVKGRRHQFRVYVILLRDTVGRRKGQLPWVYVGQTSRTPTERFRQHLERATDRKGRPVYGKVARHGEMLLPALYEHIALVYLLEDAKRLERELARSLEAEGYSVKGGH